MRKKDRMKARFTTASQSFIFPDNSFLHSPLSDNPMTTTRAHITITIHTGNAAHKTTNPINGRIHNIKVARKTKNRGIMPIYLFI